MKCIGGINMLQVRILRGLSVGAMYIMVLLAPFLDAVEVPTTPMLTVAVIALLFNLFGAISHKNEPNSAPPLMFELAFDILAWSAFIFFSGGHTNPLISILLPFVAIGAAVLPERQGWTLGLLATLAYSLLWIYNWPLVIHNQQIALHLHLTGMWLTFTVSVGISVWFISRMTAAIRQRDRELAMARENALRNEWIVSLGGLAAGAVHELSTPLSTLGTLMEEMCDESEPVTVSHSDLELMENQLSACRQALNRLARNAGHPRAEGADICTAEEWLRGLCHAWRALYPKASIRLELDPELTDLHVSPDLALEHSVKNLVDNAVKADSTSVNLLACRVEDQLEIRVEDRGPGIPQNVIQQVEQCIPHNSASGLGLGLTLAKSAVECHGGCLELTPRSGGGTVARVFLPLSEISAS
jgi:two-component system sensor histidine kinase RegB